MSLLGKIKDMCRQEIFGIKPVKYVKCPKCKTKVPSWEQSEKKCPYCKTKFIA